MDELETAVMATAWNDILGRLNSTSISLQDPTVSLNTATGLMVSLVDTVQFAWDRFDVYEQMATEKVQHGEYTRLSSIEGISESECLMKELQMKQTSAQGKRSKLRRIWS